MSNGKWTDAEGRIVRSYPAWRMRYSNEDFDRAQGLAADLTSEDRAAGRPAPAYGYSLERFADAKALILAAPRG